jgi:NADP-dependent 3-hydroxy acid dehydrogenase YdfG
VPRFAPHPDRRAAIVTGASSGIGAATAQVLAAAGHPVVLGARRLDRCESLAKAIEAAGGEALALSLDMADASSIGAFVVAADKAFGPIEVLVSNAGDAGPGTALDTAAAAFARTMEVNVIGVQRLLGLVVAPMAERRRGDVVFVTSDTARSARPGTAAYVTSKWGLEGLARVLQLELEGTGVRASIVQPGQTRTEMGMDWDVEETTRIIETWARFGFARHPNFLRPEAVAGAVLTAISAPRGTHLSFIEVQPEAPIAKSGRGEDE